MQTDALQDLLFAVMPQWYCHIAKPFKQMMHSGVSLDMYYCIRILQQVDTASMTELARRMRMPKQRMTKLADQLIEMRFVERVPDPDDRRIVRLRCTENAREYVDRFLSKDAAEYRALFDGMCEADRRDFGDALQTLQRIFAKLPDRE
ncbi:MAG: MarR family transcriptional regulator [Clostridia bacterium]|nr:MarR family transcriptional regulator [Clostridia bacterium]